MTEDQPNAVIENETSQPLSITYVSRAGESPEPAFDRPLEPGQSDLLVWPVPADGGDLVTRCLRGALTATAEDGREVAIMTGLCDGDRWVISE